MRANTQQTLLSAGLLVLTLVSRSSGSSLPFIIPSQTQPTAQASRDIDSEVSRWFAQLSSSDHEKRLQAAMELSHVEGSAATSALLSALADRSPRVRAAAAAGLAERREAPAVPLLAACLAKDKEQQAPRAVWRARL